MRSAGPLRRAEQLSERSAARASQESAETQRQAEQAAAGGAAHAHSPRRRSYRPPLFQKGGARETASRKGPAAADTPARPLPPRRRTRSGAGAQEAWGTGVLGAENTRGRAPAARAARVPEKWSGRSEAPRKVVKVPQAAAATAFHH